MTGRPKSILKCKQECDVVHTPSTTSWLSRIQSKLLLQSTQDEDEHNRLMLPKQDLKKVTFSIGNLTTEHFFSSDESPRDEVFEKQKEENKLNPQEDVIDLTSYYDHACIQREENVMDSFRSVLKNNSSSALSSVNLSLQIITLHQAGPLSDMFMLRFGLKSLNLSNCSIEDETIRLLLYSLLVSNTIEHLDLSHNSFKMKGYKYIAIFMKESKTIQSINLSKNIIEKKGMHYIALGIQYAKILKKLELNDCILRPPQIISLLSESLKKTSSSCQLSFCNNRIPPITAPYIASFISDRYNRTGGLRELDLSGNNLSSMIPLLTNELRKNISLTSLTMANCSLNTQSLCHLAESLMENNCLEYLDISSNAICAESDDGILALKTALSYNTRLESLNLSETQLDSSATIALAEALPENRTLSRLDLSNNPKIDIAGVLALSISIKMNHTLTFLDINIPFSDEELANLQNDIVTVCTTNMLKKIELQKYQEDMIENISESTTLSPSVSTSSSTSTLSISYPNKPMDELIGKKDLEEAIPPSMDTR
ncbi:hypothetical protein BDB01DRAFT_799847 [Pilobolus umbonatus]|nr:hypothetical protein BDB01DRAFT_799847 [Pilobolus umbonatus]